MELHWIEIAAVAAGLAYVWLATREHVACWSFGILNSALSIYLFVHARLYAEAFLYVYYVAAGIYGWYAWSRERDKTGQHLSIHTWKMMQHIQAILLSTALAWALGLSLRAWTDAQFPIIDVQVTIFSFLATYLTARKVLSNWLYWIAIDSVSAGLYWSRDRRLYAFLMVVYTLMAAYGYWEWRRLCGTIAR